MASGSIYKASRGHLPRLFSFTPMSSPLNNASALTTLVSNPVDTQTLRSRAFATYTTPIPLHTFTINANVANQPQIPLSFQLSFTAPSALLSTPPTRSFVTQSSTANVSLQVQVPPLGESISDGTVAVILKQPGDAVEEDEPILQIETDKVTIDVRAPKAGIIDSILVKEDENVVVGHVVAAISAADAATTTNARAPASSISDPSTSTATTTATDVSSPPSPPKQQQQKEEEKQQHRRQPSIQFPPRRTPTGDILSLMPAAEAQQAKEALAKPQRMKADPQPTHLFVRLPPRPPGPPPKPRKDLSDWEIEQIMLGGADLKM